jgi:RNA-binding protein
MVSLNNAEIRDFKAQAQRLKATLKVGKEGLSPRFLAALDDALNHHELVKVKFDDHKEEKKELAPQLAEKTGSHFITRVGMWLCFIAQSQRSQSRSTQRDPA